MTLWDWTYAWDIMPAMLRGLSITFQITILGSALAFFVGFLWTFGGRLRSRRARWSVRIAIDFVRGTPLLVQVFFIFYVGPALGVLLSPYQTGVIALGVHYSAYAGEVYRGAIGAVPVGQWEAASALNLPTRRVWQSVILPLVIRYSAPALANYVITMYKETAVLFAIGLPVLLLEARAAGSSTFRFTEPYTIAGLLYFLVSYPSAVLLRRMEARGG